MFSQDQHRAIAGRLCPRQSSFAYPDCNPTLTQTFGKLVCLVSPKVILTRRSIEPKQRRGYVRRVSKGAHKIRSQSPQAIRKLYARLIAIALAWLCSSEAHSASATLA